MKHAKVTFTKTQPKRPRKSAKGRRTGKESVLVLQSVNDALTERRIQRASRNPMLDIYRISHAFLVELNEEERSLEIEEMMQRVDRRISEPSDLFRRLNERITEVRPSFLVVHAGFVFCRVPELVLRVLSRLKSQHKTVRFGLQGADRVPSVENIALFERSVEMNELILRLF